MGVSSFGFEEELVAVFVGEALDLIFDGGAVARAYTLYAPLEHGGFFKSGTQNVVDFGAGIGDIAGQLVGEGRGIGEGELGGLFVAGLWRHTVEVDGAAIDADGGAGFEFTGGDAGGLQLVGEEGGGHFAEAAS